MIQQYTCDDYPGRGGADGQHGGGAGTPHGQWDQDAPSFSKGKDFMDNEDLNSQVIQNEYTLLLYFNLLLLKEASWLVSETSFIFYLFIGF